MSQYRVSGRKGNQRDPQTFNRSHEVSPIKIFPFNIGMYQYVNVHL